MPKFTLISEHDDSSRTTVEFERDFLPDVLMHLDMFLRGTGFSYDGSLTIEGWDEYPNNDFDSDEHNESVSKCSICGLTAEQLGPHMCWDQNCPNKPAIHTMAGTL